MPGITADQLSKVTSFPKLVSLLRDNLDWPIHKDYELEDVIYEYDPAELGLKPDEIAKIREISQLRPLITNQPWGIFFISFEEKTISVSVLRRMLRNLVFNKRGSAKSSDKQAWAKNDLIFAANFGKSTEREIAFVHFSDEGSSNDLPVLKVLGWNANDTMLHNDYVSGTLEKKLRWPDDTNDLVAWRAQWSGAFDTGYNEVIRTSKELAIGLAVLATGIRARANELLKAESEKGPMRKMLAAFRKNLIQELDNDGFADMFAQTISYGLLAAHISKPSGGLVADNLVDMVPKTNPFLRELFSTFLSLGGRDQRKRMDYDELGVREVIDMLRHANMEAVLRDFGDKNPREDPVIHFYELFLKEYDPEKRAQRGVFYTPRPVVNFIVRGVHEVLRKEFGLPLGLADTTTWDEMAAKNSKITIPPHINPESPFVQILDPATGTGTFLVETIDLIFKTMESHWKVEGRSESDIHNAWNEYVPQHLLPRLTGFELMMAPYAIAHMKIGIALQNTHYNFGSDERAHIFLTNALEPARDLKIEFSFMEEILAHEAHSANESKSNTAITVLIGNPPYANYSANLTKAARKIVDRYRSYGGKPIRERNQLQFERNIQDDYVKFLAVAQGYVGRSGVGVIGLITNATMLSSKSLRGLRESLISQFQPIFELNLHGGGNERFVDNADDENVFDIVQSVAIHIFCQMNTNSQKELKYLSFKGSRAKKYEYLLGTDLHKVNWSRIVPDAEICSFTPADENDIGNLLRLDSIFNIFGAGIKTNRDSIVIGFDEKELSRNLKSNFSFKATDNLNRDYQRIEYRPFDNRVIFYRHGYIASMSKVTMKNMLAAPNLAFVCSSSWTSPERFSVGVSDKLVEMKTGTHDRGTTLFPLFLYNSVLSGSPEKSTNFSQTLIENWKASVQTDLIASNAEIADKVQIDVFMWLYALFYSPTYRARHLKVLSSGFPVVLFPKSRDFLNAMVEKGNELAAQHLFRIEEAPALKKPDIRLAGSGEARVAASHPKYENGKVLINASRWFEDVPRETWEFYFGGYQVCDKWLKDRSAKGGKNPSPGRVLTDEDILHYCRIVTCLTETRRLMTEIDKTVEAHGGWPNAFKNNS